MGGHTLNKNILLKVVLCLLTALTPECTTPVFCKSFISLHLAPLSRTSKKLKIDLLYIDISQKSWKKLAYWSDGKIGNSQNDLQLYFVTLRLLTCLRDILTLNFDNAGVQSSLVKIISCTKEYLTKSSEMS